MALPIQIIIYFWIQKSPALLDFLKRVANLKFSLKKMGKLLIDHTILSIGAMWLVIFDHFNLAY
jgi:hypothetical protein